MTSSNCKRKFHRETPYKNNLISGCDMKKDARSPYVVLEVMGLFVQLESTSSLFSIGQIEAADFAVVSCGAAVAATKVAFFFIDRKIY